MEHLIASSAALGLVVGLILALTGAGGAILAVPLLLFVLHLKIAEAAPGPARPPEPRWNDGGACLA